MPDVVPVLCGELSRTRPHDDGAIRLDVGALEDSLERVNLRIDHITAKMVADIPGRLVDLLEIAAYVYAADQLATRGGDKMRGMGRDWRRDFHFAVPVRDPAFWKSPVTRRQLADAIGFLSDDYYDFDFRAAVSTRSIDGYLGLDGDGAPAGFAPDRVVLFSGGLDSLAGVAAGLLQQGEKLALVSHSSSTMVQSRQNELAEALRSRCPDRRMFHVSVRVTRGQEEPREFTQRTRSFLFASLAFVVARLFKKTEITFFENGIVSVNLPIAEHVIGGRATRTTHPRTLASFASLFSIVAETKIGVRNPFFYSTKSEVLRKLVDAGGGDLIARSFSCSHVRLAVSTGQQCGVCTQCIDRRFAVLAAGLEANDPKEGYGTDLLTGEREDSKDVTVAESFVLSASRYADMTETAFFGRYGELLRVLPHLVGDMSENAGRLFELHRRHGASVRRVVDAAMAQTTISAVLKLPKTCLLSLLRSHAGSRTEARRDLVELAPPAHEQASASPPQVTARHVTLVVDRKQERVVLASRVVLSGNSYALMSALADLRVTDQVEHRSEEELAFFATRRLASHFAIDDETLRRRVWRCRKALRDGLRSVPGLPNAGDDVIQSDRWQGYRLSPRVLIQSGSGSDSHRA